VPQRRRPDEVRIGVVGDPGAGKSTFINSVRGLRPRDPGAARVGLTHTTAEPIEYPHPDLPDSLVLVDFIKHQVEDYGQKWRDAVATAGTKRFRAVVLTSVTTFVGLLPIQLETSIQAQFLKPMAISVAFGVLFATIVTLFLVPSLCYITDDIGQLLGKIKARLFQRFQAAGKN